MKIAFFSIVLNHHQALFADEMYNLLGGSFVFVECENLGDCKGATETYRDRPYLLQAWENEITHEKANQIATDYDVCLFDGGFNYQCLRMKTNKLTFEVSERWLKRGWLNILSPRLLRNICTHHLRFWQRKPLYKLCSSAFAAEDQNKLGTFKNKCYKWGYFTSVPDVVRDERLEVSDVVRLMWCARFLKLKHPELPVLMAARLKEEGYKFVLDFYGAGEELEPTKQLAENLDLNNCVNFHGTVPNDQVHQAMRNTEIFLFTSDRHEGWGAVANESLSEGCVLVASDAIGSSPYLIKEGSIGSRSSSGSTEANGFMFHSSKASCSFGNPDDLALDSLCEKVEWLLEHPTERKLMQQNAIKQMQDVWSPANAARSLLQLIDDLQHGRDTSIKVGPCSKA